MLASIIIALQLVNFAQAGTPAPWTVETCYVNKSTNQSWWASDCQTRKCYYNPETNESSFVKPDYVSNEENLPEAPLGSKALPIQTLKQQAAEQAKREAALLAKYEADALATYEAGKRQAAEQAKREAAEQAKPVQVAVQAKQQASAPKCAVFYDFDHTIHQSHLYTQIMRLRSPEARIQAARQAARDVPEDRKRALLNHWQGLHANGTLLFIVSYGFAEPMRAYLAEMGAEQLFTGVYGGFKNTINGEYETRQGTSNNPRLTDADATFGGPNQDTFVCGGKRSDYNDKDWFKFERISYLLRKYKIDQGVFVDDSGCNTTSLSNVQADLMGMVAGRPVVNGGSVAIEVFAKMQNERNLYASTRLLGVTPYKCGKNGLTPRELEIIADIASDDSDIQARL